MFSARHYKQIAELLSELDVERETRDALAKLFATFFSEDNDNFNVDRWWKEVKKSDS